VGGDRHSLRLQCDHVVQPADEHEVHVLGVVARAAICARIEGSLIIARLVSSNCR